MNIVAWAKIGKRVHGIVSTIFGFTTVCQISNADAVFMQRITDYDITRLEITCPRCLKTMSAESDG